MWQFHYISLTEGSANITKTTLHTASMWYLDMQTEVTEIEGLILGMFNDAL